MQRTRTKPDVACVFSNQKKTAKLCKVKYFQCGDLYENDLQTALICLVHTLSLSDRPWSSLWTCCQGRRGHLEVSHLISHLYATSFQTSCSPPTSLALFVVAPSPCRLPPLSLAWWVLSLCPLLNLQMPQQDKDSCSRPPFESTLVAILSNYCSTVFFFYIFCWCTLSFCSLLHWLYGSVTSFEHS